MDQLDKTFADLVIEQHLASAEQVQACLEIVQKARELGAATSLADQMVGQGYITRAQADAVLARVRRSSTAGDAKVTSIAGYEIVDKLGRGATGVVYKARQVAMDRLVALKVLQPSLSKDAVYVERFFREARNAARLNHPNVVQAIDAGVDKGYHYFVMEFVDGPTLAARLKQGSLTEEQALKIAHNVAAALTHAELHGIVHRDIKPENIMLTSRGVAKLADLGIAKNFAVDASVTMEGNTLGTQHYMSPEQARGDANIDIRSDIYSLGATLFHMVTGSPPFEGETPAIVVSKRLLQPAPNARDRRPDLSVGAALLIQRMMARNANERYATAMELLGAIDDALQGKSFIGQPVPLEQRPYPIAAPAPRRSKAPLVAGVCLVLVIGAVAFYATRPAPPPGPSTASGTPQESSEPAPVSVDPIINKLKTEIDPLIGNERFGEALRRIAAFGSEFGRSHGEAETSAVQAALNALRADIQARAADRRAKLEQEVGAALKRNDFAAARGILKTVKGFEIPEAGTWADTKQAEVDAWEKNAEASAKWMAIVAEKDALMANGKYSEALRKVQEEGSKLPLPGMEELLAKEIGGIRKAQEEVASAERAKYMAAFEKQVKPLLAARDYKQGEVVHQSILGKVDRPLVEKEADGILADLVRLQAFWQSLEQRLADLQPGSILSCGGRNVSFVSYKDGMLRYSIGPVEQGTSLRKVKADDLLLLANPADDDARLNAVAFLLYEKDPNVLRASKLLAEARQPADEVERYKTAIIAFTTGSIEANERAASAAFDELCRRVSAVGLASRAKEEAWKPGYLSRLAADFLADYGKTRFLNEHLIDLEALNAADATFARLPASGKSRYLLAKQPMDWNVAKQRCVSLGGHLVTIVSGVEQAFVADKLVKPIDGIWPEIWIGASERLPKQWEWVTGEKVSYKAWHPRQPDSAPGGPNAAALTHSSFRVAWTAKSQSTARYFICEWDENSPNLSLDALRLLAETVGTGDAPDAAEYEKRLAKRITCNADILPLEYAVVAALNQASVPYLWEQSSELVGREVAGRSVESADLADSAARTGLKAILDPLGLGYAISDDGVALKRGTGVARQAVGKWQELFNGQSLKGWRVGTQAYPGSGAVFVQAGAITMEAGGPCTAIAWSGNFPTADYEVELEAKRISGRGDFGSIVFPVGGSHCLFAEGIDGMVGLELLEGRSYSQNETSRRLPFDNDRWYRIRLVVKKARITALVDEKVVFELPVAGHQFSVMSRFEPLRPFGIYTWETRASIRKIRMRPLKQAVEAE